MTDSAPVSTTSSQPDPRERFTWALPPIPGESLLGFIARNAERIGVRKMATMLRAGGLDTTRPAMLPSAFANTPNRLAEVFRIEDEEIDSRLRPRIDNAGGAGLVDFHGVPIRAGYLATAKRRVSPASLARSPHHRSVWDLKVFNFCPESLEPLISSCPECGATLGWTWTLGVHVCEGCGHDLRAAAPATPPRFDRSSIDFVTSLVDPDPDKRADHVILAGEEEDPSPANFGFARFVECPPGAMFEFAIALAWAASDKGAPRRARKLVETADFEAIKPEHIAEAGDLMLDWSRFGSFADGFRNRMGQRSGHFGVEKELGRLAYLPDDDFLHPDLRALVKDAIEENMAATAAAMAGHVVRRRKHRVADDGLMNVVDVEEFLGTNRASIKAWGESGLVKIHMAGGAKRSVMLLERAEIEAIKAERDGAITREETAALLGLPETEVAKLAVAGVFRKIEGVAGALLRIESYPRDEVDARIDTIRTFADAVPSGVQTVELARVIEGGALGGMGWPSALQAILHGYLPAYIDPDAATKPLAAALRIAHDADLPRECLFDEERCSKTFSVNDAAAFLNVSRPMISLLVKHRLLPQNGLPKQKLDRADVAEIARKYAFTTEVADLVGVDVGKVVEEMARRGVSPAHQLTATGDLLWRRWEVERTLPGANPFWEPSFDDGPGVLIPVRHDGETLYAYITDEAVWAADPNAKGDWLMSSVKANRALFERIAIGKARRGETAREGCVRIEKKDIS